MKLQNYPSILVIAILALISPSTTLQASGEIFLDGSRSLERNSSIGVGFANFVATKFHYLNITSLVTVLVNEVRECARLCVDNSR